jgi:hypothetical protein
MRPPKVSFVAVSLLAATLTACDGRSLATSGQIVDAGAEGVASKDLTIPAFVVAPVLTCDLGVGAVALVTPCQLGQGPVYEVDCAFGTAQDEVIRFMLPLSLPPVNGGFSLENIRLGELVAFHGVFVPPLATLSANGDAFALRSMNGALTLTNGSAADRSFDGWFAHLDFVWTSSTAAVTCSLDNGRFTTVPGDYL